MGLIDDLYRALLDWLKAAAPSPSLSLVYTPLTDDQVIRSRQPGPRPAKPYLTVLVTNPGTQVGELDDLPGRYVVTFPPPPRSYPTTRTRGDYRGTATITGYGDGAYDWIRTAIQRLRHPSIQVQLQAAGLTIDPLGDPVNVGELVDDEFEDRWVQDVRIVYADDSPAERLVEASTTETDYTGHGNPDDYEQTITEP